MVKRNRAPIVSGSVRIAFRDKPVRNTCNGSVNDYRAERAFFTWSVEDDDVAVQGVGSDLVNIHGEHNYDVTDFNDGPHAAAFNHKQGEGEAEKHVKHRKKKQRSGRDQNSAVKDFRKPCLQIC